MFTEFHVTVASPPVVNSVGIVGLDGVSLLHEPTFPEVSTARTRTAISVPVANSAEVTVVAVYHGSHVVPSRLISTS